MPWGGKDNNQGPWGQPGGRPGGGGNNSGGGGKRPQAPQPPDLDELIRLGHEKFRRMFPGGGGPGGSGGDGDGKRGLILVFSALGLLWLGSGIYLVKADEQGVITRFGQFHRTSPPGMGYHLPFPVEAIQTPKVTTVNRIEIGYRSNYAPRSNGTDGRKESLMLTGDENIVDINFEVQWKISTAEDFLFNVRNPEDTVKSVAESAMREVIGKTQIASVLAEGKLQVEQATRKLLQDTLNSYGAGVEIVSVNLLKVDPPEQVLEAFRDVQTARTDMETARNEAEAYRNDIIPRARGDAERMLQEAEAYKQEVTARAKGEAARFASVYAEYKEARDVTRKRMYLETMESMLNGMNKIIIDKQNAGGVLPYLPLDSLKPASGGNKEKESAQ